MSRLNTILNHSACQSICQSIRTPCNRLISEQRRYFAKINRSSKPTLSSNQTFKPRTFGRHTTHDDDDDEATTKSTKQSTNQSESPFNATLNRVKSYTVEQQKHQELIDSVKRSMKEKARISQNFDTLLFTPVIGMIGFNNQDLEYEPANEPFNAPEKKPNDPMSDPAEDTNAHYASANIRMRGAAREVIGRKLYEMAVLRSYNPAHSQSIDLRDIPIHFHRVTVSADLQFITAEWALEPNVPGTSKVTLPAKYKNFKDFQSIIREIGVVLSLSIKQIRFELGETMSTKYVPQLRFVYDQRALREDRQREAALSNVTEAQMQDFELFNPFFSSSYEAKQRTAKKRDTTRVVSEVSSKRSRRQQQQKTLIESERRERVKEGLKNGQLLYATNKSEGAIDIGAPRLRQPMKLKGDLNVPAFSAHFRQSRERE